MTDTVNNLDADQIELLEFLAGVEGCDVWSRHQAGVARSLETMKLVRIVKARNAPKDGAMAQPYFGLKITKAGERAIGYD